MDDLERKSYNTLVLDAGPIIRNSPSVSTLLQNTHKIVTLPSVISEIRDAETRSRVEITLKPFLAIREPKPESVKFIVDFARKTGDLSVLSRTDLRLAALSYELECEQNGGDWRLRRVPGQKALNGPVPRRTTADAVSTKPEAARETSIEQVPAIPEKASGTSEQDQGVNSKLSFQSGCPRENEEDPMVVKEENVNPNAGEGVIKDLSRQLSAANVADDTDVAATQTKSTIAAAESPVRSSEGASDEDGDASDSDDSEGWITPRNLKKQVTKDAEASKASLASTKNPIEVATLTTDFALQNVLLQINLNVLSATNLARIQNLRTTVLRCYGCFQIIKDTGKQFCTRCGQATLTRVAASTDSKGQFRIHLRKNWQWHHRGDKYSIPKPTSGTSNGRNLQGGGVGGWGKSLILAEDQREYEKATARAGRKKKENNLMDEDVLPSILSGHRADHTGMPKVGAGRNINAKRRKKR